jgi:thiamine biosynthesis lipoprotein
MKAVRQIMGMPVTIEVPGKPATDAIEQAFEHLRAVDRTFSTYRPDSEISRLNRGELKLTDASQQVQEVLAACDAIREQTDGYFDIRRSDGLDPSGYVKGWAVHGAAQVLRQARITNFVVNAGGDMEVSGHGPDGEPWPIGIRDPRQHDQIVKVVRLTAGGVATSGTYERGAHIYDPHTGQPARGLASVTVIADDIITADVAATTAFAMGDQAARWLADRGLVCYVIDHHGQATFTPSLQRYL